ncbi:MAG: hypothetical protein QF371_07160, partial [Flavobacteriales bacterium]|nr:hypothetical protein [Flavobacteriales bacterium]
MNKFLTQVTFFILLVGISFCGILTLADGRTDSYYIRFTVPKQNNLLIGSSRAAQGLQPRVLKEILGIDIFNYAFTARASPYGPVYFESIRKKLNSGRSDGIFILDVNPWSISSRTEHPNDSTQFRELDSFVRRTPNVNTNPNFTYLKNNLGGNYYKILWNHSPVFLHQNGWLEVTVPMDSSSIRKRTQLRLKKYVKEN